MPVILRARGYRFWFYQADLDEPPHVHVGKEGKEAKCWVDPVAIARPGRFRPQDLSEIERILVTYQQDFLEAWLREQRKREDG